MKNQARNLFNLNEQTAIPYAFHKGYGLIRPDGYYAFSEIYQKVISEARKQEDVVTLKQTLTAVGEIYLNWLDYDNAAITYE